MTIETRNAQNGPRPTAAADSKGARGKAGGADDAGGAATGGFTAILASFEAPDAPAAVAPEATDSSMGGTVALATPVTVPLKPATPLNTSDLCKHGKNADLAGVLDPSASVETEVSKVLQKGDQTETAAAALLASTQAAVPTDVTPDAALASVQSLQWSAMPTPNTVVNSQSMATGAVADAASAPKLPRPLLKAENAPTTASLAGELGSEPVGKGSKTQKDAQARLTSLSAALAAPAESSGQPDPRVLPVNPRIMEQPLAPIAAAVVMAGAPGLAKREDQARDRSVFRANATESNGIAQPILSPASSTSVQSTPDVQSPSDLYVAQKVAYWISNDVQNAQMKLDGIGAEPVEVSIRMQGNEAHVAFRTDELQARVALENASVHLKDLLQREGLVLSGVSVGTAGTGDSRDQERRPRQGVRQSVIGSVQPAQVDRSAVSRRAAGGALDLFV